MVEDSVLEQVWPSDSEAERAQQQFSEIRDYIEDEFGRDARLMGSLAKRTFLAGDKDLDIFVFFDTATAEDSLEEEGLAIGRAVFEHFGGQYQEEFAEHPYIKGEIDGFEVEIVPAYDIEDPAAMQSSVDRTPLHTEWVNEHLDDEERRQVVLLKAFLKGQGLYGSSLRVEGFSGYLCEILISRYGSFRDLLEAAIEWDRRTVIDVEDHHDDLPEHLQDRFSDEHLIVIDPTDPERNVASVLSFENYARFIHSAWQYLQDPGEEAFFPDEPTYTSDKIQQALDQHGTVLSIRFERPDVVDDILYPQLRKLERRLRDQLVDHGFRPFAIDSFVTADEIRTVVDLEVDDLPGVEKHHGPQVFHNSRHIEEFTDKYGRTWVEDGRLTTIIEREYSKAHKLLAAFLDGDLQQKGVPPDLIDPISDRTIREPVLDGEAWRRFLGDFLKVRQ